MQLPSAARAPLPAPNSSTSTLLIDCNTWATWNAMVFANRGVSSGAVTKSPLAVWPPTASLADPAA